MELISIYRDGGLVYDVKPNEDSTQRKVVMGENVVNLNFEMSIYFDFLIGDTCTIYGEDYILNSPPIVKEEGSNKYTYTLTFQSVNLDLSKAQYLFLGDDNTQRETEFPLTGTAQVFMDLVMMNIERVQPGAWTLGEVIQTETKTLTFSQENCYNVLGRLATEFQTEFWIENKTIHLAKKSRETGFTFKVGQNQGLYEITRLNVDNSAVITRLYPFGSEKNLPHYYPGRRLRLPVNINKNLVTMVTYFTFPFGSQNRVTFDYSPPTNPDVSNVILEWRSVGAIVWNEVSAGLGNTVEIGTPKTALEVRFRSILPTGSMVTATLIVSGGTLTPELPDTSPAYLEKNTEKYGIIEGVRKFEEIYPHRTGTITSVNITDPLELTDAGMDFDVNANLAEGLTPKMVFKTGQLAGYTFDIEKYDNANKRFRILKNKQETIDVPGDLKAAIGDTYVLVDLLMPQTYVDLAEAQLYEAASKVLAEVSEPQLTIQATTDQKYLKHRNRELFIGDLIWVISPNLGINRKIRITETTRNLVHEYQYELRISDVIVPGKLERTINTTQANTRELADLSRGVNAQDIFNGRLVLPTTTTSAGFDTVVIQEGTNKLFRLV